MLLLQLAAGTAQRVAEVISHVVLVLVAVIVLLIMVTRSLIVIPPLKSFPAVPVVLRLRGPLHLILLLWSVLVVVVAAVPVAVGRIPVAEVERRHRPGRVQLAGEVGGPVGLRRTRVSLERGGVVRLVSADRR